MYEEIGQLITKLETDMQNQNDADEIYTEFVDLIRQEMYRKVSYKNTKIQEGLNNKKRRMKKTWWSEELTDIWNELCLKEKSMLKSERRFKRTRRKEL